jgi:dsDNA-binding SOS-regulon protein
MAKLHQIFNTAQMAGYSVQEHHDIYEMILKEDSELNPANREAIALFMARQKELMEKYPKLANIRPPMQMGLPKKQPKSDIVKPVKLHIGRG